MAPSLDGPEFALSIKQPWVTLVLLGLKTIEIRRWATPLRGRIYLHAGKIADDRPEGWARIPKEHRALTDRRGGLVGAVDLIDCITYDSLRTFGRDRQLHCNELGWFVPPRMFGFRLEKPEAIPFQACLGQVKFFPVAEFLPKPKPARKRKIVKFEIDRR